MPSPVDSYPVNTDKIIFALTELEKIRQKQSDNAATVANVKNCPLLNMFFFPKKQIVLTMTTDTRSCSRRYRRQSVHIWRV